MSTDTTKESPTLDKTDEEPNQDGEDIKLGEDIDDLFDDFFEDEGTVGLDTNSTTEQDSPVEKIDREFDDDIEDVDDAIITEIKAEEEEEPPEEEIPEEEYEPPPPPEPIQSLTGRLWDSLPASTRKKLVSWGLEAPLDAKESSTISLGMGKKGAMLLGPPSAGKTTLIAAINRACLIPVESEIDLRWRATGDDEIQQNLTQLLDQSIGQILQDTENIKATNDHKRYDFEIEGRVKTVAHFNGAKAFHTMKMSFHDGPGGAMFTLDKAVWKSQETTRMEMLREAKGAYTLLFCFDGAQRNARMMQSSLARILPLLQGKRMGRGRNRTSYLYPMRVVILLNKIDQVCDNFYVKLSQQHPRLAQNDSVTPESIAQDLDPLSMAIECLGYESLKMLRDAMRPDAELAVGLISTWGFNNQGRPLVNSNGKPNVYTFGNQTPVNEFVSQWRPFGIREAIIYLATGREAPMLQVIQPGDFNKDLRPPDNIGF